MEIINCITVKELNKDILNNLHKIPANIDLVVGIPRSGLLVATLISLYLNLPLTDIDGLIEQHAFQHGKTKNCNNFKDFQEIETVLVVEDSSNSGSSIREVKKIIDEHCINKKIIYLAAYVTEYTTNLVDIYFRKVNTPRFF